MVLLLAVGTNLGCSPTAPRKLIQVNLPQRLAESRDDAEGLYREAVMTWRNVFREMRTDDNLKPFVSDCTGILHGVQVGADALSGRNNGRLRVARLFDAEVCDRGQLNAHMTSFLRAYEQRLIEQDRALLRAAAPSKEKRS